MKGLKLALLRADLQKVSPRYKKPIYAIRNVDKKFNGKLKALEEYFGGFSFHNDCHKLPLKAFRNFSFDELCKIRYSSIFGMDKSVMELFGKHYQYSIIEKIRNSMHRWGFSGDVWNEVVDAYNCMRNFQFHPDFEVTLDHATYSHEKGYSRYSRTFLDGAFGFLVHYKKQHVMTIGFSVVAGSKILIQQMQLTKRTKNRFLYKLPKNRLEFLIESFKRSFPRFDIYIADGSDIVEKNLEGYRDGYRIAKERSVNYNRSLHSSRGGDDEWLQEWIVELKEEMLELQEKIKHLEKDKVRLVNFYANSGHHVIKTDVVLKLNEVRHYRILF